MLNVQNLTKSIQKKLILDKVSFNITQNQIVTIVGPSGAGKSTLLKCLNQLTEYDSGTIEIDGKDLKTYTRETLSERITIVFQNYQLFPHLSVFENITLALKLKKKNTTDEMNEKANKWLSSLKLIDKKDQYPYQLSGGEKQRVAIIRACMLDSDIICFDEPTSALDPSLVLDLEEIIKTIRKDNKTILIITHDLLFAKRISDRIITLDKGSISKDESFTLNIES